MKTRLMYEVLFSHVKHQIFNPSGFLTKSLLSAGHGKILVDYSVLLTNGIAKNLSQLPRKIYGLTPFLAFLNKPKIIFVRCIV